MSVRIVVPALLLGLLAGCGSKEEAPPSQSQPQGRAETQSIRNTEAVGYDGKAIADQVDDALNKTEQRRDEQQKAIEEQAEGP